MMHARRAIQRGGVLTLAVRVSLIGLLGLMPVGVGLVPAQTIEIFYAPEDRPGDKLVGIYEKAERYIYIAAYGITYRPGVKALVKAKQRGVDVRVITDEERLKDKHQLRALYVLQRAGIPIKVDEHDGLMHLKQVVVDDTINTTGSMNLTTSGNRYNDERLNVITDPHTTAKAREKFLAMWKDSARYRPWP